MPDGSVLAVRRKSFNAQPAGVIRELVRNPGWLPTLSVIMPVHNEARTIAESLRRIAKMPVQVPWELILVDDGSTDGGLSDLETDAFVGVADVSLITFERNHGKGAAIREGFRCARGSILGVQDADLEYDPADIPGLIQPILDGKSEVVVGTRAFGPHSSYSYFYVLGNRFLSFWTSFLFNRYVTDVYTCYKFFTRESYEDLKLRADGFAIEAEMMAGFLRSRRRVMEMPISYVARSREEGKKIRFKDAAKGILVLARVRVLGS